MSKAYGQRIVLEFTQPLTTSDDSSNVGAFSISGQQYDMEPEGILSLKTYPVATVTKDGGNSKRLILDFTYANRFNRVTGALTVAYNAALGNLAGLGGPVSSFSSAFMPTDLVPKANPHEPIHIKLVSITVPTSLLKRIYYTDRQLLEGADLVKLKSIQATGILRNVNEI